MRDRSPYERKRTIRTLITVLVAVVCVLALAVFAALVPFKNLLPAYNLPVRGEGELRLHFLDVGQGDCTIVEFPEGDILVVDAGDGSYTHNNKLVRYIKGLKPAAITMLLTHADADHYGGFERLLSVFGAEKFYLPAVPSSAAAYTDLLEAIEKSGCKTDAISRYKTIESPSGAYAVCLSPYSKGEEDENDASAVLYIAYGNTRVLLCGDISSTRERRLMRDYALDNTLFDRGDCTVRLENIDILKLPHHGSAASSCREWLELLRPAAAFVSSGRGNGYSHPAGEVISRVMEASPNAEIYRGDELGDIIVTVTTEKYTVSWE